MLWCFQHSSPSHVSSFFGETFWVVSWRVDLFHSGIKLHWISTLWKTLRQLLNLLHIKENGTPTTDHVATSSLSTKRRIKMVWLLHIIVSYLEIFTSQRKEPVCPPPVRINHWWYLLPNNWNSSLLPSSSLLLPYIGWLVLYTSASTFCQTFLLRHHHRLNKIGGSSPL